MTGKQMLSEQVYERLRGSVLRGDLQPGQTLKPQELAATHGVSLAVVREALVRLVGEGLADRLPNRGFAVPEFTAERWEQIVEARMILEPAVQRLSIQRGDLAWEARLRAAQHRLERTPLFTAEDGDYLSAGWSEAHRIFHRALLEGSGNEALLALFDRLWTATELFRRWSAHQTPQRDYVHEHRRLEETALARDTELATRQLAEHLCATASALKLLADPVDPADGGAADSATTAGLPLR
jgi:DNA-binding GntR family transcriptional regulator